MNVGDTVRIQNQIGNQPKKWCSTGKVIETRPYRQYKVLRDGTRRIILRNRKFLRKTAETDRIGTHPELPKKAKEPSTQQQIQEPEEISMSQRSPWRKMTPTSPEPKNPVQEIEVEKTIISETQDDPRRLQSEQANSPLQEDVPAMAQSPSAEEVNEEDRPSKRYPTRKRKKTPRYIETC